MAGMQVIGHGIDLVETARVGELIERHGERFLHRVYTDMEREYARRNPKREIEHLAGRFAVKEAVLKALGTGWRGGITWTDVEVLRLPSGQPSAKIAGEAQRIAEKLGVETWQISISHTTTHAMASAIAMGNEKPPRD